MDLRIALGLQGVNECLGVKLLAGMDLWIAILGRILLVPVIAAVSYEVLKFGAKRRDQGFWRLLFLPGIWVQKITTKQPDDSMIEVAICSMQEALAANGDTAPAGSWDPVREPIPDVGELAREMEARLEAEEQGDVDADVDAPTAPAAPVASADAEASPEREAPVTPDRRVERPGGAAEGA
jgi:hypothetical protein